MVIWKAVDVFIPLSVQNHDFLSCCRILKRTPDDIYPSVHREQGLQTAMTAHWHSDHHQPQPQPHTPAT